MKCRQSPMPHLADLRWRDHIVAQLRRNLALSVIGGSDTGSMALRGNGAGRKVRWFRDNKGALPSIAALLAVAVLWVVGAVRGIGFLVDASSPMVMLIGLYIMLAGVAVSIIVATLALNDLLTRYSRPRTRR